MEGKTVYNFSAGPCCLPKEVLKTAQEELMDWHGTGMSVMEMSHRSQNFVSIAKKTEEDLRKLLSIPDNYKVFFFQGGASLQSTSIAKNLLGDENPKANYLVTGMWSNNSFNEAKKLGDITEVIKPQDAYTGCPEFSEWTVTEDAKYFHFCDNETVHGVEFNNFPYEELKDQLLVVDMSSNFCTRPIDWTKYGVVYAGAQKNVGPAGVTITIVREDLLGKAQKDTTSMLDWEVTAKAKDQFYNTPCCWSIYMCGLNIAYMLEKGLEKIEEECVKKSTMVYDAIANSGGYYTNPIDEKFRSRINIPVRVKKDDDLEKKFLAEATEQGLIDLKGHRTVGGLRVSIYNAMPVEGVQALVDFMKKFQEANP